MSRGGSLAVGAPLRHPAFQRLWLGLSISYLVGPVAAGFAVARLGGPWALFINAASFLLMGLLVLTLPTITREPRVAQHAAANRWLGFGVGAFAGVLTLTKLSHRWRPSIASPMIAVLWGALLQYLSAPLVIAISGLACILAGLGGFVSPSLRQLQRGSP